MGLVLHCYKDKKELDSATIEKARQIAQQSPLTIRGIKKVLNYQIDHSTEDSLNQVSQWNASMLFSEDLIEAFMGMTQKRKPSYRD